MTPLTSSTELEILESLADQAGLSLSAFLRVQFGGLNPQAWVCVGPGYSREDVKTWLLEQVGALSSATVLSPQDLAVKVVGGIAVLAGTGARREVIDRLWNNAGLLNGLDRLKRLRKRPQAVALLDQALQQGRMAFAWPEDAQAFEASLIQSRGRAGRRAFRAELGVFCAAYESVLRTCGWWDAPMFFAQANQVLQSSEPRLPSWILRLDNRVSGEPREELFWQLLGQKTRVVRLGAPVERPSEMGSAPIGEDLPGEVWHRWDDVCIRAAEMLEEDSGIAVVIPPAPEDRTARRALLRAMRGGGRKLQLEDPRDPLFARKHEGVKQALLPWQLLANGAKRADLVDWLLFLSANGTDLSQTIERVIQAGWVQARSGSDWEDLESLLGRQSFVALELRRLRLLCAGKKTVSEWGEVFWKSGGSQASPEVVAFFESLWDGWREDLVRLGDGSRRVRLLWVLQRLRWRLELAPAPIAPLRDGNGVRLFRLGQVPPLSQKENQFLSKGVLFVGVQPPVFDLQAPGVAVQDLWWDAQEREQLSLVYGVRSGRLVLQERQVQWERWRKWAQSRPGKFLLCLQLRWDEGGQERECTPSGQERGAHPETRALFYRAREQIPREVVLAAKKPEKISASLLDDWSRCSFLALGKHRWKLRDFRDAGPDGFIEDFGSLMHEAVRLRVEHSKSEAQPKESDRELTRRLVLEAWKLRPVRGLERNRLRREQVLRRAEKLLQRFWEQETQWMQAEWVRTISGGHLKDLANDDLVLEWKGAVGKPDRIFETPHGLWIQDYKSSQIGKLPTGKQMVERAYRLQLAFYAVAARVRFGQEIAGVQYVSLSMEAKRDRGIFFKKWNQAPLRSIKQKAVVPAGDAAVMPLTQLPSVNRSLMDVEPEALWSRMAQELEQALDGVQSGNYRALPKLATECENCTMRMVCGQVRQEAAETREQESSEGESV